MNPVRDRTPKLSLRRLETETQITGGQQRENEHRDRPAGGRTRAAADEREVQAGEQEQAGDDDDFRRLNRGLTTLGTGGHPPSVVLDLPGSSVTVARLHHDTAII